MLPSKGEFSAEAPEGIKQGFLQNFPQISKF